MFPEEMTTTDQDVKMYFYNQVVSDGLLLLLIGNSKNVLWLSRPYALVTNINKGQKIKLGEEKAKEW